MYSKIALLAAARVGQLRRRCVGHVAASVDRDSEWIRRRSGLFDPWFLLGPSGTTVTTAQSRDQPARSVLFPTVPHGRDTCLSLAVISNSRHRDWPSSTSAWPSRRVTVSLSVRSTYELAVDFDLDGRALAAKLNSTPAMLAIAFATANERVATVLFGATTPEQVAENARAVEVLDRLDAASLAELRTIGTRWVDVEPT